MRKDNADSLLAGLGGAKISWDEKQRLLKGEELSIIGDSLLSSGIIAYLGAFPITYRDTTLQSWIDLVKKEKILISLNFKMSNILCDPITIG